MDISILERLSADKTKEFYTLQWGRKAGERIATGIFSYTAPKNQIQKNHNKEALAILETKRSQLILETQAVNSGHIPSHKIKRNFLDFYKEFVDTNTRPGNRALTSSLSAFKDFFKQDYISAIDITENLCERFRNYLLDTFNGETPADYFMRFKRVLRSATKAGYFRVNPAEDVKAKSKPSIKKEILDASDYKRLINAYCSNYEV
ncbi:MAG TPA: phage integrase SAM-like domain-containing protein, partial [Puia sp.]|nr:phage integrase SAM-like domain-containing protein [Puia sp.]